ncbi:MAG: YkvA family protein [Pseudomonadota bacterium]
MKTPWNLVRYLPLAQRFLARGRLPALLLAASRKRNAQGGRLGGAKGDLRLLQALCLAWWRGEYRSLSSKFLLTTVAALLYFVSPLDAIPDWLLGVGFLDDIAVLTWLMKAWRSELDAFRAWHADQPAQQQAALEHLPSLEVLEHERNNT